MRAQRRSAGRRSSEVIRSTGQLNHGLSVIERSAQVQSRMVNDLLDPSRIISGKLQLELTNMDPAVVILEAVELARPSADAKGITLNV
jgi:CheY-like chemotaxis protein